MKTPVITLSSQKLSGNIHLLQSLVLLTSYFKNGQQFVGERNIHILQLRIQRVFQSLVKVNVLSKEIDFSGLLLKIVMKISLKVFVAKLTISKSKYASSSEIQTEAKHLNYAEA